MKALLLTEYMKLELTDMPAPEPGAHDVLIRVRSCGICGSDYEIRDGVTQGCRMKRSGLAVEVGC